MFPAMLRIERRISTRQQIGIQAKMRSHGSKFYVELDNGLACMPMSRMLECEETMGDGLQLKMSQVKSCKILGIKSYHRPKKFVLSRYLKENLTMVIGTHIRTVVVGLLMIMII